MYTLKYVVFSLAILHVAVVLHADPLVDHETVRLILICHNYYVFHYKVEAQASNEDFEFELPGEGLIQVRPEDPDVNENEEVNGESTDDIHAGISMEKFLNNVWPDSQYSIKNES